MSCISACLQDGIHYSRKCLTGRNVSHEDRPYLRVCLMGEHVFQVDMYYRSTSFTG